MGKTEAFLFQCSLSLRSMKKTSKRLDFGFSLIYFQKTFFPTFELLNLGCGLSVGAAYPRVFTVLALGAASLDPKQRIEDSFPSVTSLKVPLYCPCH